MIKWDKRERERERGKKRERKNKAPHKYKILYMLTQASGSIYWTRGNQLNAMVSILWDKEYALSSCLAANDVSCSSLMLKWNARNHFRWRGDIIQWEGEDRRQEKRKKTLHSLKNRPIDESRKSSLHNSFGATAACTATWLTKSIAIIKDLKETAV